jgi:hypothetical protein
MINWDSILKEIGVVGLIVGAITWLFKSLGETFLNRRFKYFEKELEAKSDSYRLGLDKDLEQYKKNLNLDLVKKERLHLKRSETLGELYKRLVDLDFSMADLTRVFQQVKENYEKEEADRIERVRTSYNDFLKYYQGHKIYFREETCKILDELVTNYFDVFWDYTYKTRTGVFDPQVAKKPYDKMQIDIPIVKKQIETDLRKFFGDD